MTKQSILQSTYNIMSSTMSAKDKLKALRRLIRKANYCPVCRSEFTEDLYPSVVKFCRKKQK